MGFCLLCLSADCSIPESVQEIRHISLSLEGNSQSLHWGGMNSYPGFENKPRGLRISQLSYQIAKYNNMNATSFSQILQKKCLSRRPELDILITKHVTEIVLR